MLLILHMSISKQETSILEEDHHRTGNVLVSSRLDPLHADNWRADSGDLVTHDLEPTRRLDTCARGPTAQEGQRRRILRESFPPAFRPSALVGGLVVRERGVARPAPWLDPSTELDEFTVFMPYLREEQAAEA